MGNSTPQWNIKSLHLHLQAACDLEFWTIPYYLTVMHSIKDRASEAYQLVRSVAYQEMLHLQLAANIANAYGTKLNLSFSNFGPEPYAGEHVPHLNFHLDTPNPTAEFRPFSAALGPLDLSRINTMCLIEYPQWFTGHRPNARENVRDYGSIGEFYSAVEVGASELSHLIRGGLLQVDLFQRFYSQFKQLKVTQDGGAGLAQVQDMVAAILFQGEGARGENDIPPAYANTADDIKPHLQHYTKFKLIRDEILAGRGPATYPGVPDPAPGTKGAEAQHILCQHMTDYFKDMNQLFCDGQLPRTFGPNMAKVGAAILQCWQHGAVPRFHA